jgi:hypothetical protein
MLEASDGVIWLKDQFATKAYGGVEVYFQLLLNSALDGDV